MSLLFFLYCSVFHPVECSYCRSESMMGFRYRCQQCHGYQLCQSCFWRGHANGPHSNQHQMKEHSSWVRQSPDHSQFYVVLFPFQNNPKANISVRVKLFYNMADYSAVYTFPVKDRKRFYGLLLIFAN